MNDHYPVWVCLECGVKALQASKTRRKTLSTWHMAVCDVCMKEAAVTQPRDFGYPSFKKEQQRTVLSGLPESPS